MKMSSPHSSLKKTKRIPIANNGQNQRSMPFRTAAQTEDNQLLDDILSNRTPGLRTAKRDGSPSSSSSTEPAPSDLELMSSMMQKIGQLEKRVTAYSREIIEKDRRIKVLEEKVQLLNKYRASNLDSSDSAGKEKTRELEKKCESLQEQIQDMEEFLADYGMIWVGPAEDGGEEDRGGGGGGLQPLGGSAAPVWNPGASTVSWDDFRMNFDLVAENIRELNLVAGEGVHKVQHTVGGARLRAPDPIPLTLYANGIVMFKGPFRSYNEPETQLCMKDIMDGYFPSELQKRYPEGIPFQVTDLREVLFKPRSEEAEFPGAGQLLGGETRPSLLVPSNLDKFPAAAAATPAHTAGRPLKIATEVPGPKVPLDTFLDRLPRSVVHNGKVIDIRSSVGQSLKGSGPAKTEVTVLETDIVKDLRQRSAGSHAGSPRLPSASRQVTTLRVKSEKGDHTYIVKMKFMDTLGDLRQYLDSQRSPGEPPYDLLTTFPHAVYSDLEATLLESGLTPNANLLMKPRKG